MRMNDKRTGTQDFMKYLINIGKGPQDRQIQAVKETRDMKTGEQEVPLDQRSKENWTQASKTTAHHSMQTEKIKHKERQVETDSVIVLEIGSKNSLIKYRSVGQILTKTEQQRVFLIELEEELMQAQEICQTKTLEMKKINKALRSSQQQIGRYQEKYEAKIKEIEDQKSNLENVEEELFYAKAKNRELEQELEKQKKLSQEASSKQLREAFKQDYKHFSFKQAGSQNRIVSPFSSSGLTSARSEDKRKFKIKSKKRVKRSHKKNGEKEKSKPELTRFSTMNQGKEESKTFEKKTTLRRVDSQEESLSLDFESEDSGPDSEQIQIMEQKEEENIKIRRQHSLQIQFHLGRKVVSFVIGQYREKAQIILTAAQKIQRSEIKYLIPKKLIHKVIDKSYNELIRLEASQLERITLHQYLLLSCLTEYGTIKVAEKKYEQLLHSIKRFAEIQRSRIKLFAQFLGLMGSKKLEHSDFIDYLKLLRLAHFSRGAVKQKEEGLLTVFSNPSDHSHDELMLKQEMVFALATTLFLDKLKVVEMKALHFELDQLLDQQPNRTEDVAFDPIALHLVMALRKERERYSKFAISIFHSMDLLQKKRLKIEECAQFIDAILSFHHFRDVQERQRILQIFEAVIKEKSDLQNSQTKSFYISQEEWVHTVVCLRDVFDLNSVREFQATDAITIYQHMNEVKANLDNLLDLIIARAKKAGKFDYFLVKKLQFLRRLFVEAHEEQFTIQEIWFAYMLLQRRSIRSYALKSEEDCFPKIFSCFSHLYNPLDQSSSFKRKNERRSAYQSTVTVKIKDKFAERAKTQNTTRRLLLANMPTP